jgi:hypothetical protein
MLDNGIDGADLLELAESDLSNLGVEINPLLLKKLMRKHAEFRDRANGGSSKGADGGGSATTPSASENVTKGGLSIPGVPTDKVTHVFLTHDWGDDEMGRKNHSRVEKVNIGLKQRGIVPWFDSDKMTGQVLDKMCEGIDETQLMVVFITQRYLDKIGGKDMRDNCKYEFTYAFKQLGPQKMIPVVMENRVRDTGRWKGQGGAAMSPLLYIDMVEDSNINQKIGT